MLDQGTKQGLVWWYFMISRWQKCIICMWWKHCRVSHQSSRYVDLVGADRYQHSWATYDGHFPDPKWWANEKLRVFRTGFCDVWPMKPWKMWNQETVIQSQMTGLFWGSSHRLIRKAEKTIRWQHHSLRLTSQDEIISRQSKAKLSSIIFLRLLVYFF